MRVTLILSPAIGSVNPKQLAGLETVFFSDVQSIKKNNLASAYARFTNIHPEIKKIYFPTFLQWISRFTYRPRRLWGITSQLLQLISHIIYLSIIKIKDDGKGIIIGYSLPTLPVIFPKNSIVFLHSFETFYFPSLFFNRYKNATYLFVSKFLKDYYQKKYPFITEKNSRVLYNAVDDTVFIPKRKKATKQIKLVYVSAWEKEKGLEILLKAMSSLPTNAKLRFQLTIASSEHLWYREAFNSNTKYINDCKKLIRQVKNVKVIGGVNNNSMPLLYQTHDYLTFPSIWDEPFGLAVLESIFCHTPVVAFRTGALPEILGDKINSILIKKRTVSALRKTLIDISKEKILVHNPIPTKKNSCMKKEEREELLAKVLKDAKKQKGMNLLSY